MIDVNGNIITDADLSKGYLVDTQVIKADASPIDNITKFAWEDSDYETVQMYVMNPEQNKEPSPDDDRDSMLIDMEYRLLTLELGL